VVDVTDEGFRWPCSQHARSAAALDDRGHLLLVTFDGKHGAAGVSLPQLGQFLVDELHARQALNLDGGGSTTLYLGGRGVVNLPSDDNGGPAPRHVYDGLFVYTTSQ
jgi:exopolysaccharide biosynthesis protein